MKRGIALVTLVVADYAEALSFFVDQLGFELTQDRVLDGDKRWLVVTPPGELGTGLLLAKAAGVRQSAAVGAQTGGRVAFFLHTDDFERDHRRFLSKGVRFIEAPRREEYGTVAVFEDLYANRWDLLQPAA